MVRAAALIMIVVSSVPVPSAAQAGARFTKGDRVRVWTSERTVTGQVSATAPDRIELQPDGGEPALSIPLATVRKVEISRGRPNRAQRARTGAKWGALLGGGLGAVSLGVQHQQVGDGGSSVGKAAALGAFSGGLFGGLIGAGIGAVRSGDKWEHVYP